MTSRNNVKIEPVGILIHANEYAHEIDYWCKMLGFELVESSDEYTSLRNNELFVIIYSDGQYNNSLPNNYVGLEHIALKSRDIISDISKYQSHGVCINTDNGRPYFNPKVWGKGTLYFNFRNTPESIIEICQRIDDPCKSQNITLSHIGIPTSSYPETSHFFRKLGFVVDNEVINITNEGKVICGIFDMLPFHLEIYQFLDKNGYATSECSYYRGLIFKCDSLDCCYEYIRKNYCATSLMHNTKRGIPYFSFFAPDGIKIFIYSEIQEEQKDG